MLIFQNLSGFIFVLFYLKKKNAGCNPVNEFYDLPVSQGLLIEVLTLGMT